MFLISFAWLQQAIHFIGSGSAWTFRFQSKQSPTYPSLCQKETDLVASSDFWRPSFVKRKRVGIVVLVNLTLTSHLCWTDRLQFFWTRKRNWKLHSSNQSLKFKNRNNFLHTNLTGLRFVPLSSISRAKFFQYYNVYNLSTSWSVSNANLHFIHF